MQLKFSVQDTGIGIAPEQMDLLFKNFSQADSSTSRQYGGTGLGLAIAKTLTEMMDGTVGVYSEPNRGSIFWCSVWFDLPETAPTAAVDSAPQPLDVLVWPNSVQPDASDPVAPQTHSAPLPLATDGSPGALLGHRLAWLAAQDDPAALDWFGTHTTELKHRLGASFERVQRALWVRRWAHVPAAAGAVLDGLGEVGKSHQHVVGLDVRQSERPDAGGVDDHELPGRAVQDAPDRAPGRLRLVGGDRHLLPD